MKSCSFHIVLYSITDFVLYKIRLKILNLTSHLIKTQRTSFRFLYVSLNAKLKYTVGTSVRGLVHVGEITVGQDISNEQLQLL